MLQSTAAPRSTAGRRMDTWIHVDTYKCAVLRILQYMDTKVLRIPHNCAYLHRSSIADTGYCIADTADTHAPSSSTRPRVQPYTAHHSLTSSDPLLQLHTKSAGCTAKSALPHPFPLTNIGHACPSRLIAETYTSHDHSLTVLLTLESCSSRVTVSISGGKVTPNFAYNTLFEHHGVGYATLGGH